MRYTYAIKTGIALAVFGLATTSFAQQYPPQQQYPPPAGQYPPAQQQPQYPAPQGQYPNPQYPPAQGQYPPVRGQYPPAQGQYPAGPPPYVSPEQLNDIVQRIALYPDPLLAQILTASTFSDQIPQAAAWANQHSYLHGEQLASAIQQDQLPWDPSVLALIPFPQVLNMMASDLGWTQGLGNAVLANRDAVMNSIQQERQQAYSYGYLQNNQYDRVIYQPGAIQIMPVNPGLLYVPSYNPSVVFVRPRPGFFVGGAIHFGPGITIGAGFSPFWANPYLGWREHNIIIGGRPWVRTWGNRGVYVHPYEGWRRPEGGRIEMHDFRGRNEHHER